MAPPWDTYAHELMDVGYGYPLWNPTPRDGEVQIGDVGYLLKGQFIRLFNAALPADNDANKLLVKLGVPDGFDPLKIPEHLLVSNEFLFSGETVMREENHAAFQTEASANIANVAEVSFAYRNAVTKRATLKLPTKKASGLEISRHNNLVPRYFVDNLANWHRWAIQQANITADIILVTGWVKSAQWTVSVRVEKGQKMFGLLGRGGHPSVAGGSVSISRTRNASGSWLHCSGPAATSDECQNQCLFLHFYKGRNRWIRWVAEISAMDYFIPPAIPCSVDASAAARAAQKSMEAEMEVDEILENDSDEGTSESPALEAMYDPVDPLLDYVFESTDASMAVVSTADYYKLSQDGAPSSTVKEWLGERQPRIHLTKCTNLEFGFLGENDDPALVDRVSLASNQSSPADCGKEPGQIAKPLVPDKGNMIDTEKHEGSAILHVTSHQADDPCGERAHPCNDADWWETSGSVEFGKLIAGCLP